MSVDERTTTTPADHHATEVLSTGSTAVLTDAAPEPSGEWDAGAQTARTEQTPFYGTPPVAPPVPVAAPSSTPPFSLTSLILGVASVFFGLTLIAPIAGLVFGILGLRREPAGRTLAIWGIVLNAVSLGFVALMIAAMMLFGLLIPFAALAGGTELG